VEARDRIRAFSRELAERLAERREPSSVGEGLLADSLPGVYDLNYVLADRGDGAEIRGEVERLLEPFHHRKAITYHDVDLAWPQAVHLVMAHAREPDRRVDTSHVREVDFEQIAPLRLYDYEDTEVGEQLNEAQRRVGRAVATRWLAAFDGDELAAWCHVRTGDGVSQIEDVNTLPPYRGRGHGRAVVQHALDEAAGLVFLEALEDDWPRELYAKVGFDVVDRKTHHIVRGHALTSLRIRTPRLELRLATVAELRALFRVAAAGIHDPAVMPFEIPWTDDLHEERFLAYHRENLARASRDAYSLNLVVFLDGRPIGTQGINSHGPGRVSTGSWLGAAYQRQGYGTEMRNAILTLAFDFIGADVAVSGAFVDNPGSRGVSRRLGYRETGSHVVTPRGEPVEHVDLELRREDFRPLVDVEVTGWRW
jgi:RimJ/RimL family protein N-acetyltransferase/predicted GNAT family acetyltransferase